MEKITKSSLMTMKPREFFASGEAYVEDYWDVKKTMKIKWVAVRGVKEDWAIYYSTDLNSHIEKIATYGQKMKNMKEIKKIVPCDDTAFKLYRIN